MKFMRFAVGRGKSKLKIDNFMTGVLQGLTYPTKNIEDQEVGDMNALLPLCDLYGNKGHTYGSGLTLDSCNLFEPVLTNAGLCHAFNPTPTADLLAPSYFRPGFVF